MWVRIFNLEVETGHLNLTKKEIKTIQSWIGRI